MSKSIIVIDTPSSCCFCDFCHTKEYDSRHKIDGEKFCCIEDIDVEKYYYAAFQKEFIKPDWCPLKEIPEKTTNEFTIGTSTRAFVNGWNSCIDHILKE